MSERAYKTKEEVLARGKAAIGIPLKEIDKNGRISIGKGAIGSVLEESWFGYKINSESAPDFAEAGVELKATPYIRTNKGIRAKERLVCNIINYMTEYKETFKTSSFWKKCNTMLIMSYEHKENIPKYEFKIDEAVLFSFPIEDLIIIEQDWQKIMQKIRQGKAHEISEGDTLYLGACTKGANSNSLRKQPFSDILAKQRAYSLKQSYMTYLLNTYIYGQKTDEHIIKDSDELISIGFEDYIIKKIKPYLGRTQQSLKAEFNIDSTAKNLNELILARMLGITGKISSTEEFQKANIVPKTIRIAANGTIKESMSFPTFEFKKIVQENWVESEFKSYLEQTKFLFIIFRFNEKKELIFNDLMFWNMPYEDIEEVRSVWEKTILILKTGVELKRKNGKIFNNLPKQTENPVAHVRPHGRDSHDVLELPDGQHMTKQSFWLNNNYIKSQIEKKNQTNQHNE